MIAIGSRPLNPEANRFLVIDATRDQVMGQVPRDPGAPRPELSIGIATKNRRDDLRRALLSCRKQAGNIEVIVADDGSTDGTAELVHREFPEVRLHRFEQSGGCVSRRNFLASVACAPVVFSMDDDAEFSGSQIVEVSRRGFANPRVGAVAIPYIDVREDPALVKQCMPPEGGPYVVASYRGTAHAIRRDIFLALGGYRASVEHQGEEGDYCIRMLEAGFVVAGFDTDPIMHYESPRRDFRRVDVYGRRNDVLFAWWNVPMPFLPLHLTGTVLNGVRFGIRHGRLAPMLRGIWQGCADAVGLEERRKPVHVRTYRLHRYLKKRGPVALSSIEHILGSSRGP